MVFVLRLLRNFRSARTWKMPIASILAMLMSIATMQATSNPSNIPPLEHNVSAFNGKVEFWNRLSFVFVAVTAFSAVAYGVAQGYLNNRQKLLSNAQSELATAEENQLRLDLRDKDLEIEKAQKLAGDAQTDAGRANERAGALESANLKLKTDLETATAASRAKEIELEKEQQKTAEIQRKSAEAQLALRKAAEIAVTPRRLIMDNRNGDEKIRAAKFAKLGKYSDCPAIVVYIQDEEAQILAFDIRNALLQAGWKSVPIIDRGTTQIPLGFIREGVQLRTVLEETATVAAIGIPTPNATPPPLVDALFNLLNLDLGPPIGAPFGVRWEPEGWLHLKEPTGLMRYGFEIPKNGVVITVGRNPTEFLFLGIPDLETTAK
jgi:hypothetical protein